MTLTALPLAIISKIYSSCRKLKHSLVLVLETIAKRVLQACVVEKTKTKHSISRIAFTLAEILIVLGIIGLIADMTIPTLISKTQEKVAVAKLKKVYTTLDSAFRLAVAENGNVRDWFDVNKSDKENSTIFYNNLKPYLKITKDCGTEAGCWTKGYLRGMTGIDYNNYDDNAKEPKIQLADGTALMFLIEIYYDEVDYGNIKVDIDGFKGTYQWGKDVFVFNISKDKIIPLGLPEENHYSFDKYCNMSEPKRDSGVGCTAWVIYNENMDYLHCNDLSWDGKKQCK